MDKIFGIGLSRTGTMSLCRALKFLGYNIIHSPRPVVMPDMIQTLNKYAGGVDSPVAFRFRELDKEFPGSKFIFTTRDLDSWLASYEYYFTHMHPDNRYDETVKEFYIQYYGDSYFNKETFTKAYYDHHKNVLDYFKDRPNDFLIMNIMDGDGWEKLCGFLNKDVPNKWFPHQHKSKK